MIGGFGGEVQQRHVVKESSTDYMLLVLEDVPNRISKTITKTGKAMPH
jgi:hypothetical protein